MGNNYSSDIYGNYIFENYEACYAYSFDSEYQNEENYFGSIGKFGTKVIGRTSQSFIKYGSERVILFAGRVHRNFGLVNSKSLILSDNPFSYDHFSITIKNNIVHYLFLATRLEDIYGYDVHDEFVVNKWNKRYLTFHRIDFSISNKLKLAFSESILYGGENQNILPMYLNPMNVFFISKMVERKGIEERRANVLMALDLYYAGPLELFLRSKFVRNIEKT